jgi:glycosyltransferase involved in cell wall biosynthesis
VPCYNEKDSVNPTIKNLNDQLAGFGSFEIIAVDDGSTDGTEKRLEQIALETNTVKLIRHESNRGYGAALKSGIRSARGCYVAITDCDGTYPHDRILDLLSHAQDGADMVVGARIGEGVTYSKLRAIPKAFMRRYCVWVTRQPIPDMNSGFRVFKRETLVEYLPYLPDTFSFTTTVTIAFMTRQHRVDYIPVSYSKRVGASKISPIKDTIRFCQLILRTAIYFAPLRVFFPLIAVLWGGFIAAASYDFFIAKDFSDKTVLLLTFAANCTMLALIADMIDKRLP